MHVVYGFLPITRHLKFSQALNWHWKAKIYLWPYIKHQKRSRVRTQKQLRTTPVIMALAFAVLVMSLSTSQCLPLRCLQKPVSLASKKSRYLCASWARGASRMGWQPSNSSRPERVSGGSWSCGGDNSQFEEEERDPKDATSTKRIENETPCSSLVSFSSRWPTKHDIWVSDAIQGKRTNALSHARQHTHSWFRNIALVFQRFGKGFLGAFSSTAPGRLRAQH